MIQPLNCKCQLLGSPEFSGTSSKTRFHSDYNMATHSVHNFLETEKNYGNGGQCVVTIWIDHTAMAFLPRSKPYRRYSPGYGRSYQFRWIPELDRTSKQLKRAGKAVQTGLPLSGVSYFKKGTNWPKLWRNERYQLVMDASTFCRNCSQLQATALGQLVEDILKAILSMFCKNLIATILSNT